MEQIKAFIEKAKSEKELMAKLNAMGAFNYEGDINGTPKNQIQI